MSYSEILPINEAINLLIIVKNKLRQITPTFIMDKKQFQEINDYLIKINNAITKLNEYFGIKFPIEPKKELNFKEKIKNKFFIVNSSKNRKKLLDLGFDSAQILATDGPITIEDIKTLNPQISDSALENLKNKIQKFWKILKSKMKSGNYNKVILLIEEKNIADKILKNYKDEFEKKLSLSIEIITISTFNLLDTQFLSFINS